MVASNLAALLTLLPYLLMNAKEQYLCEHYCTLNALYTLFGAMLHVTYCTFVINCCTSHSHNTNYFTHKKHQEVGSALKGQNKKSLIFFQFIPVDYN